MNKPNKIELEYFIRYSLDSDKYKRYMELYDEIERLKQEYIILQNASDEVEEDLQQRISKAIEYIENDMFEDYCVVHKDSEQRLLSILKGTDLTKNDKNQIRWLKEEFKVGDDKE